MVAISSQLCPEPPIPLHPPRLSARAITAAAAAQRDRELVRRFNGGDESAFDEIVGYYRRKLYEVALARLRNHTDAEEIAQDTFIRAYRGLSRFRGDSSLSTWLHHITVNLSRNRYWHFFRRFRHATVSLDCPLGEGGADVFSDLIASSDTSPAQDAATSDFAEVVSRCMAQLAASQREILLLRNELDRSYEEIALQMGIKIGTVKSRIARAREKLRASVAESYPEFTVGSALINGSEPPCLAGFVAVATT
jgi:RNA polymerase sigma-70 factor (ECF subfamily)